MADRHPKTHADEHAQFCLLHHTLRQTLHEEAPAIGAAIALSACFHAALLVVLVFVAPRSGAAPRAQVPAPPVEIALRTEPPPPEIMEARSFSSDLPSPRDVLRRAFEPEQIQWDERVTDIDVTAELARLDAEPTLKLSGEHPYNRRTSGGRRQAIQLWGGSDETERAVEAALDWLARHQNADGHWDMHLAVDQWSAGGRTSSPSYAWGTPAVNGLCLLAFLGAGYTDQDPRYGGVVRGAVEYLLRTQDEAGCIGASVERHMYNHAIGTLALAEAYALMKRELWRLPVTRAARLLVISQKHDGGWRYDFERAGASDTSVSGWAVMALKSAEAGGIAIPERTLNDARAWFQTATFRDGTVYYQLGGVPTIPCTAIGLFCKQLLGARPDEVQMESGYAALLRQRPPPATLLGREESGRLTIDPGEINYYYWYYASLALFQAGGDTWRQWNESLRSALLTLQRTGGDAAGSYDPHGAWASAAGRTYATAVAALTLEVYYRYLPLYERQEVPDDPVVRAYYDAVRAYRQFLELDRRRTQEAEGAADEAADLLRNTLALIQERLPAAYEASAQRYAEWRRAAVLRLASVEIRRGRHAAAIALLDEADLWMESTADRALRERLLVTAFNAEADAAAAEKDYGAEFNMRRYAIDALIRLLSLEPSQPYNTYLAAASQLTEWRQYEKASWVYRRMAQRFENDPEERESFRKLLPGIANTYYELGEWDVAIYFLQLMDAGYPNVPEIKLKLARAYAESGDPEAAARLYLAARAFQAENTPDWWQAEYALAMMYFTRGDYRAVLELIERDKVLYPELGGAFYRPRLLAILEIAAVRAPAAP